MKPEYAPTVNSMDAGESSRSIIGPDDAILVTGATGFIGSRVVQSLLERGFRNVRCFARASSKLDKLTAPSQNDARAVVIQGNLQSREDCIRATRDVKVVYHLAAGRGEKSIPDAFMNSVVTTRNLLEATVQHKCLRRFVNISSFAVYTNQENPRGGVLDEQCAMEKHPELRCDAYDFAKIRQDEMVMDYGRRFDIPYVIVRPGYVYGPGNEKISGRVGLGTFGIFLHLGGSNRIPFTYVDNCADAIVLAGIQAGVDGEIFNVVDDDLPTSRKFLCLYKKRVESFRSIYMPHLVSYTLSYFWERYSIWSEGQLPMSFSRRKWYVFWKKTGYSNEKLKTKLGWKPRVSTAEGLNRLFESCRDRKQHA